MKKKVVIIGIIIVLIMSGIFIINNIDKGFRGIKLGMTIEQVKQIEKSKGSVPFPEEINESPVNYVRVKWHEYNLQLTYNFDSNKKLNDFSVIILSKGLDNESIDNNDVNNIVLYLKNELSSKNIKESTTNTENGKAITTTITNKHMKVSVVNNYDSGSDGTLGKCVILFEPIK